MARKDTFSVSKGLKKGLVIDGRLTFSKKIGEGAAGAVWLCEDTTLNKKIAVKVLESEADSDRFEREMKVMRAVKHANVVRFMGKGLVNGCPYIAMEYVKNGSMRDLLDTRVGRKIKSDEAAWLLMQTVAGLQAVSVVHRDLKPENILIQQPKGAKKSDVFFDEKGVTVAKVADFGLAKKPRTSERLTRTNQIMGTPVYMSPEQCRETKTVTVKTDIYAIGIMLYEAVIGKPPFEGKTLYDTLKMQVENEVSWPKYMSSGVREICERCLQKAPSKRYSGLKPLYNALSKLAKVDTSISSDQIIKKKSSFFLYYFIFLLIGIVVCGFIFYDDLPWLQDIMSKILGDKNGNG